MKWLFRRKRYVVALERSFMARPKTVWDRLMKIQWLDGEVTWKQGTAHVLWDGTRIKVIKVKPPHQLLFYWIPMVGDRTPVEVHVQLMPDGKTHLKLEHRDLTSEEARRKFRQRWSKVMDQIAGAKHR